MKHYRVIYERKDGTRNSWFMTEMELEEFKIVFKDNLKLYGLEFEELNFGSNESLYWFGRKGMYNLETVSIFERNEVGL